MGFMPSRIWTQQPQQALEVDRSHRFAQGLIWASIADGPNLLAPTAYPTFAGAYRRELGVAGRCVKAPSAQSAGTATWSAALSIPAGSDYTFAIFAKPSTDAGGVVTHAFPGTNLNELALSASGFTATIDNNTSNTASYSGTKPELFMASRIGNQAYVYVPNGTTSNSITGTRAQNITSVVVGRPTGNNFVNTETYLILVFTRSFSVREYRDFAQNPWQIFKPIQRNIFASVSGGGSTITCNSGVASASGSDASVAQNITILAGSGLANASGNQAAVFQALVIGASVGYASASGFDASVSYAGGVTISCAAANASASGLNASVSNATAITASIGAASASGFTCAISTGAGTSLSQDDINAIADAVWAKMLGALSASDMVGRLYAIAANKMITDPATGTITVYADDSTTPLLTADIFKDAAGTTPYNGTGAERREKLA